MVHGARCGRPNCHPCTVNDSPRSGCAASCCWAHNDTAHSTNRTGNVSSVAGPGQRGLRRESLQHGKRTPASPSHTAPGHYCESVFRRPAVRGPVDTIGGSVGVGLASRAARIAARQDGQGFRPRR
jgi:hypothetical protein